MAKSLSSKKVIGVALASCTVISCSFVAGTLGGFLGNKLAQSAETTAQIGTQNITITNESSAIIDVAEQASPAVVSIVITKDLPVYQSPLYDYLYPGRNQQNSGETEKTQVGAGSGFIISQEGLILTNRHVVSDDSAEYTVVMNDGTTYAASIVGRDTVLDVAVLKIDAGSDLPFLSFGDSDAIKIGQQVIAIGNSLGEFSNTVSSGIVSGLGRSITAGDSSGAAELLSNIIQTDASINPGNSGGPLLDITGNVIGINVAIAQNAENIGFAIPINAVKQVVDSIEKYGEIVRPYLGVRYQMLTSEIASANELSVDYGAWIVIDPSATESSVIAGGPADEAGLKPGDIILEIDGKQVTTDNDLSTIIQTYQVGDTIQIKYQRGDQQNTTSAKLEKRTE
ncbi:trypsin-like peptidase domain-containing protein [Candidatus Dojkabacteria bacterium]|uniref:Trypsin-like peptidase domain-containing protein n=1 Tax=Candidatus Dojkabacteria bacterium TaxID=2099670 RepID=A0A955I7F2_9BACT|nr:trypsin-like peptidase domain-containing protein [Candidatus Dojkabacteria bacterium]